jgi:hydrophobic/amphiphilic exporter-1 (mainly G- bacteria), HAE1 family
MTLSSVAIKRPVFTVMVTAALVILGLVGLTRLGTDLFPDVQFPFVVVTTVYPGAGPGDVENQVTKPIEDAVVSLNGIDKVRSFSREGVSTVFLIFKLDVDVQVAATEARERVAQARFKLPTDVKDPVVSRLDVSQTPIVSYTLQADRPLSEVRKYADDVIKPALEQIDGVSSVQVKGGATREIRVDLDPARMESLGIPPDAVVMSLRAANLNVPAGRFDEGAREIAVRSVGELPNVEAVRDLVVTTARDGSAVRLRDVANVTDGFAEMRTRIRVNGQEAVSFEVQKQSGRNTVEIADAARARLADMENAFPKGMSASLIFDQSQFIRENAHEVEIAIVFGGAMAILIILIFMLDLRSTLISALALPTSVIATFFLMYALGFTLNMMTLLGLSLAIGLLIDDAVVVRENIFKHLERGVPPREAAERGTQEIALSVLATTLTIVAVFVPVAFMDGIVGMFFKQFGLTVSAAVLLSLFVAFTLDPMLSARFSKTVEHKKDGWAAAVKRPFEIVFRAMDDTYRGVLGWALRHKLAVFGIALGSLIGMGQIAAIMGSDFVNPEDRGEWNIDIELPAGTSLEETSRLSAQAEASILKEIPVVKTLLATLGPESETNKARFRIRSNSKNERTTTLEQLKDKSREICSRIPGAKVVITDPAFIEGAGVQAAIMIMANGEKYEEIVPVARKIADALASTPGVADIQVKYSPGMPELKVAVDRQRAADQGIAVAQIAMSLRTAVEGEEATKLRLGKDEIPVVVRIRPEDRASQQDLSRIKLWSPKGVVAVGDVATLERGDGPQVIERENRTRQVAVWATPRGRSLGEIVAELQPKIDKIELPAGVVITYDGQIKQMTESNASMGLALLLGVIFIYLVLASQFESFIHPLTIMLTLPLALVGAVVGLFLTKNSMAMGAMIGIILLMGLVTKNAILLVDRAIVRVREHNETPYQAILEAGPERLRPILMTSAAMILGMLPTAVSRGDGSEFRAPMAIAVIGGVISSTLLSLVVVPAFYLAIENAKGWIAKKRGKGTDAALPHAAE